MEREEYTAFCGALYCQGWKQRSTRCRPKGDYCCDGGEWIEPSLAGRYNLTIRYYLGRRCPLEFPSLGLPVPEITGLMHTPVSLLERLRLPDAEAAWERFVELYTPLLYYWARRRAALQAAEAADLVQEVLSLLVRKLPEFTYNHQKSFRNWLRTVLLNTWRQQQRQRVEITADSKVLSHVAVPDHALELGEAEYHQFLARRALELMQREFEPATWQACWENVVHGKPVSAIAVELGLSANAVYLAKSRVLRRLRQELKGLLEF